MRHPRHPSSAEAGFGLVEVLITAVVVLILATAVLTGIDAASSASGRTKARSIASTLAQRDQERMRALDVESLNNRRDETKATQCDADGATACIEYIIESRAQWISDQSSRASCTATDGRLDYLELISMVSWPDMRGAKPVVMKSIYSPPVGAFKKDQGSLAVRLVGADGVTPIQGVRVTLTGPKALSDVTNELGCVVWGYLPAGNGYAIGLNESGYVDKQGVQAVSMPTSVTAESLTTRELLYDRAATARVSFFSRIGTAPNVTTYAGQQAERITLGQSSMSPASRLFPLAVPTARAASITTAPLFPFKSTSSGGRYSIYAGSCTTQDPSRQTVTAPATPDVPFTLPDLTPGAADVPIALQLPAIDTRITVNGAVPDPTRDQPRFKITQVTPSCTPAVSSWWSDAGTTSPDVGRLMHMGVPYGAYRLCAQAIVGTRVRHRTFGTLTAPLWVRTLAGLRVGTNGVINLDATNSLDGDCSAA